MSPGNNKCSSSQLVLYLMLSGVLLAYQLSRKIRLEIDKFVGANNEQKHEPSEMKLKP